MPRNFHDFCPEICTLAPNLAHWRFSASETRSRRRSLCTVFVNSRWNGWTVFPTSRHDIRQKDQRKCQGEDLCLTDLACFFVCAGDGFAPDALSAFDPNLQKRCRTIGSRSGFPTTLC